jgi:hypothetical protein
MSNKALGIPGIEDGYANFERELETNVQGKYKWEVLYDPTTTLFRDSDDDQLQNLYDANAQGLRTVVRDDGTPYNSGGFKNNLILDSGLDKLACMATAQVSQWCEAGTGDQHTVTGANITRPTKECDSTASIEVETSTGSKTQADWDKVRSDATCIIRLNDFRELTKDDEGALLYWRGDVGNKTGGGAIELVSRDEYSATPGNYTYAQVRIKHVNTFTGKEGTIQIVEGDNLHTNYKSPSDADNWRDGNGQDADKFQFELHHVQQTELQAPYKMAQFYVEGRDDNTGSIFCGTGVNYEGNDPSGNIESIELIRTYDFYMELTPVTYRELGFMESPGADSLFSRIVLDEEIHLHAGQFLRVSYHLFIGLDPATDENAAANDLDADWDGSTVTVPSTGWTDTGNANDLTGREKLQYLGIAAVTDTGVAEPWDESGLCNEIFAPGSFHFGPGYGYPNRWKTGSQTVQHPADPTVDTAAISPIDGSAITSAQANSQTVTLNTTGLITAKSVERDSSARLTSYNDRYILYGDEPAVQEGTLLAATPNPTARNTSFTTQLKGSGGYMVIDNPTVASGDIITRDTIYSSVIGHREGGSIYELDVTETPLSTTTIGSQWTSTPPAYSFNNYTFEVRSNFDLISGYYRGLSSLVATTYWGNGIWGPLPVGASTHYDVIVEPGYGNSPSYEANRKSSLSNDDYHPAWIGTILYNNQEYNKTPVGIPSHIGSQGRCTLDAYQGSYQTWSCDIDLTKLLLTNSAGDDILPTGGGVNTVGATWSNVGSNFYAKSPPTIKAYIKRNKKVKTGYTRNVDTADFRGIKQSTSYSSTFTSARYKNHPLMLTTKSFFDLDVSLDTGTGSISAVSGGSKTGGVKFYTEAEAFEANSTPDIVDISSLLEFNVNVHHDGTLTITNTTISNQLLDPQLATVADEPEKTIWPGDELQLVIENAIPAGKIANPGPVWEYDQPDQNPHIIGGNIFNPPYLRPIYQHSTTRNYLPRIYGTTYYEFNNGITSYVGEKDSTLLWGGAAGVGQNYAGAVGLSKSISGGGQGGGGAPIFTKQCITGIHQYIAGEHRSHFMEPVIKYDPADQSKGTLWDPVACDPGFVPQPAQDDWTASQNQIWVIDDQATTNGKVKYPNYTSSTSTYDVPVYVSFDPKDDSVMYVTTSALSGTFNLTNDVFPSMPYELNAQTQKKSIYQKLLDQDTYAFDDIIRYEVTITNLSGADPQEFISPTHSNTFEILDSNRDTLKLSPKPLYNYEGKLEDVYTNTANKYDPTTGALVANGDFDSNQQESPFTAPVSNGYQTAQLTIKRVVNARAHYNKNTSNVIYWPNWLNPTAENAVISTHPQARTHNTTGEQILPASRLAKSPVAGASAFISNVGALSGSGDVISTGSLKDARKFKPTGQGVDRSGTEFPLNSDTAIASWTTGPDSAPGMTTWASVSADRSGQSFESPLTSSVYQPGSFTLTKFAQFESNFANRNDWCVIGVGPTSTDSLQDPRIMKNAARWAGYTFMFKPVQEKLDTHVLRTYFKYTWDRDLTK